MSIESEARAEAEKRWPHTGNGGDLDYSRSVRRLTFTQGAKWHASRPVTAEQIEAACAGFYNDPHGLTKWKRLAEVEPVLADKYRAGMRNALEAAREAGA